MYGHQGLEVRIKINEESQACKTIDRKTEKDVDIINCKSNEYLSSFTAHGLSRALTGHYAKRFFWGLLILISLSIIIYTVLVLAVKYNKKDVYIQLYTEEYSAFANPFLTICPTEFEQIRFCSITKIVCKTFTYLSAT